MCVVLFVGYCFFLLLLECLVFVCLVFLVWFFCFVGVGFLVCIGGCVVLGWGFGVGFFLICCGGFWLWYGIRLLVDLL